MTFRPEQVRALVRYRMGQARETVREAQIAAQPQLGSGVRWYDG